MRFVSGDVIDSDEWKCPEDCLHGLLMPSPPRRAGKAMRSLMSSLQAFWPVSDGMSQVLIISSSGLNNSSALGIVLERKVHLFTIISRA